MNIRELAAHCNLSISSVSRALNNPLEKAQMSRKTYDSVHTVARELGYRPNYYARAFHKKASNCIGFIGGSSMNYIGATLLEGLSDVLDSHEITTYLSPTRNDLQREVKAFDKMFYRNVDAIVYLPILQEGKYRIDHLNQLLKDNPDHPPILSILGGVEHPDMFQLWMKDAEAGRKAALRQLQLGCRKFGIISTVDQAPSEGYATNAYRNTLLANGILPENISEVDIRLLFPEDKQELLRGIDGLWIIYYLLIPASHCALSQVCDLKKLHVDTVSTLENEDLLFWLQMGFDRTKRIGDYFASLNVFQYSSYQIGVQTGEMAIRMINTPNLKPYKLELEWNDFIPRTPAAAR